MIGRTSAGQLAPPVHVSAGSHAPEAARQIVPGGANESPGHEGVPPGQVSATSHAPAAARQVLPLANASAGQLAELPLQLSATSHGPAEPRQTPLANASPGHVAL